jgi:hypothetical protein
MQNGLTYRKLNEYQ